MNKDNILEQLFLAEESCMAICFNSCPAGVSLNTSNQAPSKKLIRMTPDCTA